MTSILEYIVVAYDETQKGADLKLYTLPDFGCYSKNIDWLTVSVFFFFVSMFAGMDSNQQLESRSLLRISDLVLKIS